MDTAHKRTAPRRGFAYVLALVMLTVFMSLAVVMTTQAHYNVAMGGNQTDALQARMAAESGMAYAIHALRDCQSQPTLTELPDMLDVIQDYIQTRLPGVAVHQFEQDLLPRRVETDPITLSNGHSFRFHVYVEEENEEGIPTKLQMVTIGQSGGIVRRIGMQYNVEVNKKLLHYAVVSTARIIARGNIRINGPITSTWGRDLRPGCRNETTYPLNIKLGSQGYIRGDIGTVLTREQFEGDQSGDADFTSGVLWDEAVPWDDPNYSGPAFIDPLNPGDNVRVGDPSYDGPTYTVPDFRDNPDEAIREQLLYEENPSVTEFDFDTTPLKEMTATINLPSADSTSTWENWGDLNHPAKAALNNIRVPKGTNPTFKNCTFKGVTYIEVDEDTTSPTSGNQNRVKFVDCTFEGPIITGVPKKMDWNKNRMDFEGATQFKSSMIQAALGGVTLMAPNYNVNIGDCVDSTGGNLDSNSEIVGLVLGGVVDLRDKVRVKGTVVSLAKIVLDDGSIIMGKNNSWLAGSDVCGANLGYESGGSEGGGDEGNNDVEITPDPDNVIPLGVKKRYIVTPDIESYLEMY